MARETKKTPYGQPPLDESVEDFFLSPRGKKALRRAMVVGAGFILSVVFLYYAFMSGVYVYSARTTYGYSHALALLFSPGRRLFREADEAARAGRLKEAVVLLKGALRRDARLFAGYVEMGDVLLKMKKQKEALTSFLGAYAIDPANYYACKRIGKIYIDEQKYVLSLSYLKKASILALWDKEVFLLLGEAYEGLGEDVEAIEAYETSKTKLPVTGKIAEDIEIRIKKLKERTYPE